MNEHDQAELRLALFRYRSLRVKQVLEQAREVRYILACTKQGTSVRVSLTLAIAELEEVTQSRYFRDWNASEINRIGGTLKDLIAKGLEILNWKELL